MADDTTGAGGAGDGAGAGEKTVPYTRFAEVNTKYTQLQEQFDALKNAGGDSAELALKAKMLEKANAKYQRELEEWQGKATTYQQELEDTRLKGTFAKHGIEDDDIAEFVATAWKKVQPGEDGKKPEFGAWFETFSANKSWLKAGSSAKTETKTPPKNNAGAKSPGAGKAIAPEDIIQMDAETWKASKADLIRQLSKRGH